ncbi:MAG: hypothetical protein ACE361_17045 [Aureliella sp.]
MNVDIVDSVRHPSVDLLGQPASQFVRRHIAKILPPAAVLRLRHVVLGRPHPGSVYLAFAQVVDVLANVDRQQRVRMLLADLRFGLRQDLGANTLGGFD